MIQNNLDKEQIDESTLDLPALLILKRGSIRTLSDGKKIAEYSHESSGVRFIYPMMFFKGEKR